MAPFKLSGASKKIKIDQSLLEQESIDPMSKNQVTKTQQDILREKFTRNTRAFSPTHFLFSTDEEENPTMSSFNERKHVDISDTDLSKKASVFGERNDERNF